MKKTFFLLLILSSSLLKTSSAQTYIRIDYDLITDSVLSKHNYCCDKTLVFTYLISGVASGYNPLTDSITLQMFFGDGIDSVFKTGIHNDSLFTYIGFAPHHYADTGFVNIKLLAIAPDNKRDSVIKEDFLVGDVCDSIAGYIYEDMNGNCVLYSEPIISYSNPPRLLMNQRDITSILYYYTDGYRYSFRVPTGYSYEVTLSQNINGNYCPTSHSINTLPAYGANFGHQCSAASDLTGTLSSSVFVPGNQQNVYILSINAGCVMTNGLVKLIYDPLLLTLTSSQPSCTVSGDTLIWPTGDIMAANYSLQGAHFYVSTSAVIGDTLHFTLIEHPLTPDSDTTNNIRNYSFPIVSSFDPNDKQVTPQGSGAQGYISSDQNMYYTVNFQNTGTAPAQNIYVLDTLDPNLDLGTFTFLNSSHQATYHLLEDRVVRFNFRNIHLPDSGTDYNGSCGYLTYCIRQNPGLTPGTAISNRAAIYFDYNEAVMTNRVINTIEYPTASIAEEKPEKVEIQPNPGDGHIHIRFSNPNPIRSYEIHVMNILGQCVKPVQKIKKESGMIDLSDLPAGIYTIHFMTSGKRHVIKYVKY